MNNIYDDYLPEKENNLKIVKNMQQ